MLNPATEKLVINSFMASYTMLYAQHNFYLDDDVVSKVAFYKSGSQELTAFFPATEKLYTCGHNYWCCKSLCAYLECWAVFGNYGILPCFIAP